MASQYLGGRVVKILTGQRRVGKSYILRQIAMLLVQSGVPTNNILIINRELTVFDFIETSHDLDQFIQAHIKKNYDLKVVSISSLTKCKK